MVNEINGIGASAQGLGYVGGAQAGQVRQWVTPREPGTPAIRSGERQDSFAVLAGAKDDAAQAIKSIGEADKALGKADALLGDMASASQMVKNYPPFPEGNDLRVNYINQIIGLRKELAALTFPRIEDTQAPVFYPRESDLPALDALKSSDQAIAAFGEAAQAMQAKIGESYAQLQAQVDSIGQKINRDLPQAPTGEAEVRILAGTISSGLGQSGQSLLNGGQTLGKLVG
ncbi:MAG: hypothetical protein WC474_08725 [Hydrogenophilaceae bacterium]